MHLCQKRQKLFSQLSLNSNYIISICQVHVIIYKNSLITFPSSSNFLTVLHFLLLISSCKNGVTWFKYFCMNIAFFPLSKSSGKNGVRNVGVITTWKIHGKNGVRNVGVLTAWKILGKNGVRNVGLITTWKTHATQHDLAAPACVHLFLTEWKYRTAVFNFF